MFIAFCALLMSIMVFFLSIDGFFHGDDWTFINMFKNWNEISDILVELIPPSDWFWRPVFIYYFGAVYKFAGDFYPVYRLLSSLLHGLNCLLIYLIVKSFTNSRVSFIAAILFLTSFLTYENRLWISAVSDILAMTNALLSVLVLKKYYEKENNFLLYLAIIFMVFSILSKESIIPATLFLIPFIHSKRNWKKNMTIFYAFVIFFIILHLPSAQWAGPVPKKAGYNLISSWEQIFTNISSYLSYLFFPFILPIVKIMDSTIPREFITHSYLWIIFPALLIIYGRKSIKYASLMAIVSIIPFSFLWLASRYLYIPIVGSLFCWAILLDKLIEKRKIHRYIAILSIIAWIFIDISALFIKVPYYNFAGILCKDIAQKSVKLLKNYPDGHKFIIENMPINIDGDILIFYSGTALKDAIEYYEGPKNLIFSSKNDEHDSSNSKIMKFVFDENNELSISLE